MYKKDGCFCNLFNLCRKKNEIRERENLIRKSSRASGIRVAELQKTLQILVNTRYLITTPVEQPKSIKGFIIKIIIPQCNYENFLEYLDENEINTDTDPTNTNPCIIYFQFIEALKLLNQLDPDNKIFNELMNYNIPKKYGIQN
jgi:hypothetical protein